MPGMTLHAVEIGQLQGEDIVERLAPHVCKNSPYACHDAAGNHRKLQKNLHAERTP